MEWTGLEVADFVGCPRNEDDRQTSSHSQSDPKDHNSQNERQSTNLINDDA